MNNPVVIGSSDAFLHLVLEAGEPVLVDFTAAWCAPCRQLAPLLDELAARHAGRIRVAVVDVESMPELAQRYRVTSMPTLLGFHRGQVVSQTVGFGGRGRVERLFGELAALGSEAQPTG